METFYIIWHSKQHPHWLSKALDAGWMASAQATGTEAHVAITNPGHRWTGTINQRFCFVSSPRSVKCVRKLLQGIMSYHIFGLLCYIVLLYELKNLKEILWQYLQNLQTSLMSLSTQINKIGGNRASVLPAWTTVSKDRCKQAMRAPSKQNCY